MNTFYIDEQNRLDPEDARHACRVLRLRPGEEIEALDGKGGRFLARIETITEKMCEVAVLSELPANESPISITVYQGVPKSDKLEFLAQKLTELGVTRLVPVRMSRSVAKSDGDKRVDRLRKIAREAAKQCHRALPMEVASPLDWKAALQDMAACDALIAPWEEAKDGRISDLSLEAKHFGILIGPEGGISPEEIAQVEELGAKVVTLGPRIFRTETAAVVAASLVQAGWGDV